MPRITDNAEILRAIGRFLDEAAVGTFEIVNQHAYVGVSWQTPDPGAPRSQHAWQESELDELRASARALRQGSTGPVGSLVELLRTIGQELDIEGVDLSSIRRDHRAFHVSGELEGKHFQAQYQTKDLVAIAAARRAARGQSPATPATVAGKSRARAELHHSFFGVTVGAQVYAEDGELIGEVTDIRNRYFKVTKPPHEDCWLPAESVGSVRRNGDVLLSPLYSETNEVS